MDWYALAIQAGLAVFAAGVSWGAASRTIKGLERSIEAEAKRHTEERAELHRSQAALHRRLDDAERRVIRLEAQLEFFAKRHDEVITDLRQALLRIETRLEALIKARPEA